MVALVATNSPSKTDAASLMDFRSVTGPVQFRSNEACAGTPGTNLNSAFGMLKKSNIAAFVNASDARPAAGFAVTASSETCSVQNNPDGYGLMPGSKS